MPDDPAAPRKAAERLNSRYNTLTTRMLEPEAVSAVALALRFPDSGIRPEVTEQDLADALLLVEDARESLNLRIDGDELQLLHQLRAAGWTWERIGTHLGYPPDSARQVSSGRYRRLKKRLPSALPSMPAQTDV